MVCEKMWKNTVEQGRTNITILNISITRWIPNPTDTHSEYVIFFYFPLTMVALKSTACLVVINIPSVHKLQMMSDRDTTYRTSIASVICKMGDTCVIQLNVIV
jgi:hypothetical protein